MYVLNLLSVEECADFPSDVFVSMQFPDILIAYNSFTHRGVRRSAIMRERRLRLACKIHSGLAPRELPVESDSREVALRMSVLELVMARRALVFLAGRKISKPRRLAVELEALLDGVRGRNRRARSAG